MVIQLLGEKSGSLRHAFYIKTIRTVIVQMRSYVKKKIKAKYNHQKRLFEKCKVSLSMNTLRLNGSFSYAVIGTRHMTVM